VSAAAPTPRVSWVDALCATAATWAWADVLLGRAPGWPEAALGALWLGGLVLASTTLAARGYVRAVTRGPSARPRVALSFDDGPDPATTQAVLDTLAAHGARATFFVLGAKVDAHPALARRIRDGGCELGVHGYEHSWRAWATPGRARASLERAQASLERAAGVRPRLVRPPYGISTPALRSAVRATAVTVVGWSIRTFDSLGRGDPLERARAVVARARPGDIVLLHDAPRTAGGRPPLGPAMLEALLTGLAAKGLTAVSVSELWGR